MDGDQKPKLISTHPQLPQQLAVFVKKKDQYADFNSNLLFFCRTQEGPATPGFSIFIRSDKGREGGRLVCLLRSNIGPYTFIKGQRDRGTEGQGDKGAKGKREKGTKGSRGQRDKGTKGQRKKNDKGTKGQRDKGTKKHRDKKQRDNTGA